MGGKMKAALGPFPKIVPGLLVEYRAGKPLAGRRRVKSVDDADLVYTGGESGANEPRGAFNHSEFWSYFQPVEESKPVEIVAEVVAPEEAADYRSGDEIAQSLREWWLDTASQEIEPLISKMFEYGGATGTDSNLVNLGRQMVAAGIPVDARFLTDRGNQQDGHLAEIAIYFYVQGKMARWAAAVSEGRPVSDDTLLDIGIYTRMVQRIRAVGGWPV